MDTRTQYPALRWPCAILELQAYHLDQLPRSGPAERGGRVSRPEEHGSAYTTGPGSLLSALVRETTAAVRIVDPESAPRPALQRAQR